MRKEGDQAEDVGPGQEAERDVLRVELVRQEPLEAVEVGDDVVVCEVDSLGEVKDRQEGGCLGVASGAGGVDDDGDVVLGGLDGARDGGGGHLCSPPKGMGGR
jgi:hypothetical protein